MSAPRSITRGAESSDPSLSAPAGGHGSLGKLILAPAFLWWAVFLITRLR